MKKLSEQKVKFLVAGFAAIWMFCPALLQQLSASDKSNRASFASGGGQNLILFKRGALDTGARIDLDTSEEDRHAISRMSIPSGKSMRLVQFAGPIRPAWISSLRAAGAEIIGYVPQNAYIIRGGAQEHARVAMLHGDAELEEARPIRWISRLSAVQKVDPTYSDEMLTGASKEAVDVEI